MFKSVAVLAVIAFATVSAGFIGTHTIVEPAVAKVGAVVHSVPSAVSHQSFTRIHNKAEISEIVAPVVKTVQLAPVIKAVPVLKTVEVAPIVKSVHVAPVVQSYSAPVVQSYAAAPVVQSYAAPVVSGVHYAAPVVSAYAAAPVVHAAPVLKTVVSPVTYAVHH